MECSSRLFFVDHHGVLRTGRDLSKEDAAIHVLKVNAESFLERFSNGKGNPELL